MKAQALHKLDALVAELAREKAAAENDYNVRIVCQCLERQLNELRQLVALIREEAS